MTTHSFIVKKLFENKNFDEIIKNEINFFFFIQQTFFIISLYLTIFLLNIYFSDNSSLIKTTLILIIGFSVFLFANKNKIRDRYQNNKGFKNKYISQFIFKIIKQHYKFKIMSFLTSRNDIYKILLVKMRYKYIYENLIKNDKINDDRKSLIQNFLFSNIENMTNSDILFMANLNIENDHKSQNIKHIIEYSKRIKLHKIQENIKNY